MKYILDLLFPDVEAGNYTALVVIVCVAFTLWLLTAVARWRTFNKMGEAGWKALVPFYSLYILYSKCWSTKAAWNCIMGIIVSALFEFGAFKTNGEIATILCSIGELMVAVYMLYLTVRINFRMAKAFGHGVGFGFGLWLFPYIFTFIIGFGKSEYSGNPLPKAKSNS